MQPHHIFLGLGLSAVIGFLILNSPALQNETIQTILSVEHLIVKVSDFLLHIFNSYKGV